MSKLLIITGLIGMLSFQQEKLVNTKIGDHIKVSLPESFYPMSESDLAQRYPSVRQPIGAFTNTSRLVDFSVKISATQWRESDVVMARDFFKASLINMYDRVNVIKEGIETINKRDFIVFEMDTRINGDRYKESMNDAVRQYVYIQYLIINGKTLVFTFTCPEQLKEKWQPVAQEVMQSVKVKNGI